ncbi:MAG: hypothetical protein Tp136SUR676911_32 [Prokaryotic dsDNA virus sp.]|mgnify:CR=1 FL=1|jgi:hypothetical protein|nr:MAG: hypothetical protein Tp136SUR676911_32 [Prokaryotic dsDNA virus sp.]|tara:strand:- start:17934 stop:18086 length:153 start_codon:yes stop_codon:yes gene_type:complete
MKLDLTEQQIQLIINELSKRPYKTVASTLQAIGLQVSQQQQREAKNDKLD